MNIPLLDPFESNQFPEVIEDILEDLSATIAAFNRRGTLLAVGCTTGVVAVVDFVTRGIATYLAGHSRPLASLCWSRNGRRLLTCSSDRLLILWDVESGMIVRKNEFNAAVTFAQLHPTNRDLAFACVVGEDPALLDFAAEDAAVADGEVQEGRVQRLPLASTLTAAAAAGAGEEGAAAAKKPAGKKKAADGNTTGAFSKDGTRVYVGDSQGNIVVFEAAMGAEAVLKQTVRVGGGAGIRSITFNRSGEQFVINSNDRVVRLFETASCTCLQEFRDVVNNLRWRKCTFSSDGDYIVGGSAEEAKHNLYIWNPLDGQLLKILVPHSSPLPVVASIFSASNSPRAGGAEGRAAGPGVAPAAPDDRLGLDLGPGLHLVHTPHRVVVGFRAGLQGAGGERGVRGARGRVRRCGRDEGGAEEGGRRGGGRRHHDHREDRRLLLRLRERTLLPANRAGARPGSRR